MLLPAASAEDGGLATASASQTPSTENNERRAGNLMRQRIYYEARTKRPPEAQGTTAPSGRWPGSALLAACAGCGARREGADPSLRGDDELDAAVALAAGGRAVGLDGLIGTVAARLHAVGGYALADQVLAHGVGA